jgi:hypothetical protein
MLKIILLALVAVALAQDCDPMDIEIVHGSPGSGAGYCGSGAADGDHCFISCDTGYEPVGDLYQCVAGEYVGTIACDDIDECSSDPCGEHASSCENCLDTFECICECNWGGSTCEEAMYCATLADPSYGHFEYSTSGDLGDGATATLTCDEGYSLVDEASHTCNCNGVWEPTTFGHCEPNPCPDTAAPEHGTVSSTTGITLDEITYTCENECDESGACVYYDMVGESFAVCLTTGEWSTPAPTCVEPECTDLCAPEDGTVTYSYTDSDDGMHTGRATWACNEGYTLEGASHSDCENSGVWSTTECPTCVPNPCPELGSMEYGSVTSHTGVTGDVVEYSCATIDGVTYTLHGESVCECLTTGEWSCTPPTCELPVCECWSSPTYGTVSCDGYTSTWTCNEGYSLVGIEGTSCIAEGTWSDTEEPVCEPNPCPDASAVADSTVCDSAGTCGATAGGVTTDTIYYDCNDGYSIGATGCEVRTCETTGDWSCEEPTCELSCTWETPEYGHADIDGTVLTTTCGCGYTLTGGESVTTCTDAGWVPAPSSSYICEANPCYEFTIEHGSLSATSATVGGSIVVSCDSGYYLVGEATLTCVPDEESCGETYDNALPTCERLSCSSLSSPSYGSVTTDDGDLYGSVATYECDTGYTLSGDVTRTCSVSGGVMYWSGEEPVCEENDCAPLATVPTYGTTGTCGDSIAPGETCTIECDTGYEVVGSPYTCEGGSLYSPDGQSCHDFDNCASGPCQNGGTCNDCLDSYTCSCPTGYTGDSCEYACDVDTGVCDCASVTCSGEPACGEGKVAVIYEDVSDTNCCAVYTCVDDDGSTGEVLSGLTDLWWYRREVDTVGCFSGYNCACFDEQNPPSALTSTYGYTVSGDTTGCDSSGLGEGVPTGEILVLDDGPCNFQWDDFEGAVIMTRDSGFSCMFQSMFGTDAYGTIWSYTGSSEITWTTPESFGTDASFSGDSVVYTNVITEAGYTEGDYTIVWRPDIMTGYFTGYPDMCAFGVFMITRNTDGRSWCWVHMGPTDMNMVTYGMSYDRLAEIMDYAIQHSDCYTMPSAVKAQLLAKAAPGKDISAAVKKNEQERARAGANMVMENDRLSRSVKTEAGSSTESRFSVTAVAVAVPVAAVALVAAAVVYKKRTSGDFAYSALPVTDVEV